MVSPFPMAAQSSCIIVIFSPLETDTWEYPNGSRLSQLKRPEAETIAKSSPVKKVSVEIGDSNVEPITKRIAELEAAKDEGIPSRSKKVGQHNDGRPTTNIFAALIILFLGVILGKFFLCSMKFLIGNVISSAYNVQDT